MAPSSPSTGDRSPNATRVPSTLASARAAGLRRNRRRRTGGGALRLTSRWRNQRMTIKPQRGS
eukprot:4561012-Lingulodinium_polyedra.AAC.1